MLNAQIPFFFLLAVTRRQLFTTYLQFMIHPDPAFPEPIPADSSAFLLHNRQMRADCSWHVQATDSWRSPHCTQPSSCQMGPPVASHFVTKVGDVFLVFRHSMSTLTSTCQRERMVRKSASGGKWLTRIRVKTGNPFHAWRSWRVCQVCERYVYSLYYICHPW